MSDSTYYGPSPNQPLSRNEEIIQDTLDGKITDIDPQSRIEELLLELQALIEAGGGSGGGGTTNYRFLSNKPKINGVIIVDNKTAADLGLLEPDDLVPMSNDEIDALFEDSSSSGSQG